MIGHGSKYEWTGRLLAGRSGLLIDLGARDQRLRSRLPPGIEYRSAEKHGVADYQWDLERPIPLPDRSVDYLVALDVLEHLEAMHAALDETLRVARKAVILSLPNMSCLSLRLKFLFGGSFGAKYSLATCGGDRHRWLTGAGQISTWVEGAATRACFRSERIDLVGGFDRLHNGLARLPLSGDLRAYTILYFLERIES